MRTPSDSPNLLTPAEAARLLRVNPITVTRWARKGLLTSIQVGPGGHRRYLEAEVLALLDGTPRRGRQ